MPSPPGLAIRLDGTTDPLRSARLAAAADRAGFRTVWFAENPFQRGVLPAASASAVATTAIGIGIGVFNPFNRHPSLMAMEIAALDELAGGRAILGIGVGVPPVIARFAGFERPVAAMRDAVAILRARCSPPMRSRSASPRRGATSRSKSPRWGRACCASRARSATGC